MTSASISIVVCTRNRCRFLPQALEALAAIRSRRGWELILVDNGSTDQTGEVLERFARTPPEGVVVRRLLEPVAGLARARNAGLRASSGDIVAFTDDDCYPAPDYVDRLADLFADPAIGFGGGRVLLFDPTDLPITIQLSEEPRRLSPGVAIPIGLIHGANFAFRRDVLTAIGGFDVHLGAGGRCKSAEDVDALLRAAALGSVGAYDPRLVVFHHHRRRTLEEKRTLFDAYDVGLGAYYWKHLGDSRIRPIVLPPFSKSMAAHVLKLRLRRLVNWARGAALYRGVRRRREMA